MADNLYLWTTAKIIGKVLSMTPQTATPATTLEQLRNGRSYQEIRDAVYDRLGPLAPTMETIRTYHTKGPRRPDLLTLLALCDVYDVNLSDVDPVMAHQLGAMKEQVISRFEWTANQLQPAGR